VIGKFLGFEKKSFSDGNLLRIKIEDWKNMNSLIISDLDNLGVVIK